MEASWYQKPLLGSKFAQFCLPSQVATRIISIGLPPIYKFGSDEMKERIVRPCLAGLKSTCLAITEPYGGSDVAGVRTTAVLSSDGTHYVVNGKPMTHMQHAEKS